MKSYEEEAQRRLEDANIRNISIQVWWEAAPTCAEPFYVQLVLISTGMSHPTY